MGPGCSVAFLGHGLLGLNAGAPHFAPPSKDDVSYAKQVLFQARPGLIVDCHATDGVQPFIRKRGWVDHRPSTVNVFVTVQLAAEGSGLYIAQQVPKTTFPPSHWNVAEGRPPRRRGRIVLHRQTERDHFRSRPGEDLERCQLSAAGGDDGAARQDILLRFARMALHLGAALEDCAVAQAPSSLAAQAVAETGSVPGPMAAVVAVQVRPLLEPAGRRQALVRLRSPIWKYNCPHPPSPTPA